MISNWGAQVYGAVTMNNTLCLGLFLLARSPAPCVVQSIAGAPTTLCCMQHCNAGLGCFLFWACNALSGNFGGLGPALHVSH